MPGQGAVGRAGAGPENLPRPCSVGQSAGGATLALTHSSALVARGGTPGQQLGDRNRATGWGGGALCHRGRGPCSPATSGVSRGLWVPFVSIQSLRKAWVALRCARRCVMEKPALPSSWDRITNTCLWREPWVQGSSLRHSNPTSAPAIPPLSWQSQSVPAIPPLSWQSHLCLDTTTLSTPPCQAWLCLFPSLLPAPSQPL